MNTVLATRCPSWCAGGHHPDQAHASRSRVTAGIGAYLTQAPDSTTPHVVINLDDYTRLELPIRTAHQLALNLLTLTLTHQDPP